MPRVRDVLLRFRPSGTPGAATAAGVPVDRANEVAAELEPVFDLLAETERECARIIEDAVAESVGIRARDAARARAVVASGQALVESERRTASTRSRGAGGAGAVAAAGGAGPAGPAGPAGETLEHHVALVVDAVRDLLRQGIRSDDSMGGVR
jgi:hypothetical protein